MEEIIKRCHIEFLGMMGSGKTTYSRIMNDLLYKKLGYFPGPQASYLSIQADLNFFPKILKIIPQSILYRLPSFFLQQWIKREYHWQEFYLNNKVLVDSLQKLIKENDKKNQYNSEEFEYFKALSFYYQAMVINRNQSCFIIDEGFLNSIRHFVLDENCQPVDSNLYLMDLIPEVSVIVNCLIPPELALSRLQCRKAGIPQFLLQFDDIGKIKILDIIKEMNNGLIDMMKSRGVKVLELDSEDSINLNTDKIEKFVKLEIFKMDL